MLSQQLVSGHGWRCSVTVQLCWKRSNAPPRACPLRSLSSVGIGVDPRWAKGKSIYLACHLLWSLFHVCNSRRNPHVLTFSSSKWLHYKILCWRKEVFERGENCSHLLVPWGWLPASLSLLPTATVCCCRATLSVQDGVLAEARSLSPFLLPHSALNGTQPLPARAVISHMQLWLKSHHVALIALSSTSLVLVWIL